MAGVVFCIFYQFYSFLSQLSLRHDVNKFKVVPHLKVLPSPLEESRRGFLLAEFVVNRHERLDHWNAWLAVKLVLLVVQGLGVGTTLDGLLAEENRVERERTFVAVLHELGKV